MKLLHHKKFVIKNVSDDIPRHEKFPYNSEKGFYQHIENRQQSLKYLIVHHTAGGIKAGIESITSIAQYHITERDFPGIAYHYYVPYAAEYITEKPVIYQCWDNNWITWHCRHANKYSIGIAFQGYFYSRYYSTIQCNVLSEFQKNIALSVLPIFCETLSSGHLKLMGHFDFGKPACPGDELEHHIRNYRGEKIKFIPSKKTLENWHDKQTTLARLNYLDISNVTGVYDEHTRIAIEKFQKANNLITDGIWGKQTQTKIKEME